MVDSRSRQLSFLLVNADRALNISSQQIPLVKSVASRRNLDGEPTDHISFRTGRPSGGRFQLLQGSYVVKEAANLETFGLTTEITEITGNCPN